MEKLNLETRKIGDIVTDNFKAAQIFKKYGLDFCCGGNVSLQQACNEKRLDVSLLTQELTDLDNLPRDNTHNFKEWELDFLCDYIINTHHKTVNGLLPHLMTYTHKIADVHGAHHSELIQIAALFTQLNDELIQHLKQEEEVLFPAIKEALRSESSESGKIILSEITRMSKEHEFAGGTMDQINKLSSNYLLPPDACNTYVVTYKYLEQFEDDLHIHVHLENNVVYPRALLLK